MHGLLSLATAAAAAPILPPDPAPSTLHGKRWSRQLDCEHVGLETGVQRYPGLIAPEAPRGEYIDRSVVVCRQRLLPTGLRAPEDEAVLSTLEATVTDLAASATSLRTDLKDRTWLVETFYTSPTLAAKISFAAKNALARDGLRVSDRAPSLAADDVEILSRIDPDDAMRAACQRYSAVGSLHDGDALFGVVRRDPRETLLHAGVCAQGQWTWLQ